MQKTSDKTRAEGLLEKINPSVIAEWERTHLPPGQNIAALVQEFREIGKRQEQLDKRSILVLATCITITVLLLIMIVVQHHSDLIMAVPMSCVILTAFMCVLLLKNRWEEKKSQKYLKKMFEIIPSINRFESATLDLMRASNDFRHPSQ